MSRIATREINGQRYYPTQPTWLDEYDRRVQAEHERQQRPPLNVRHIQRALRALHIATLGEGELAELQGRLEYERDADAGLVGFGRLYGDAPAPAPAYVPLRDELMRTRGEISDLRHALALARVSAPPAPAPCTYPDAWPEEPAHAPPDAGTCAVCLERAPATVYLPCAHVASCVTCAATQRPTQCPICRKPLTAVHRVYMS